MDGEGGVMEERRKEGGDLCVYLFLFCNPKDNDCDA